MIATATKPDIRRLEKTDAAALRQIWRETKGSAPPKTFTARLMRVSLAWDAQAALTGGESVIAHRAWKRITMARSDAQALQSTSDAGQAIVSDGTRILKDWGGTTHEVLITANDSVTWNGQRYSSLSAVARAMTGTNRNGPKFFGLREGARP